MGAVAWDWIPDELRLTAGAAWPGRRDTGVVPVAGLEWTPNEDWKLSLILPVPAFSDALGIPSHQKPGSMPRGRLYGGPFDVRRADGRPDELSIREFQATVGVELKNDHLGRGFCEVGAGLGRELQYGRGQEVVDFGPGVVLRIGLTR